MLTVRTAAVLAMIAGSVAPMTVSARGEPRGGSTFTCSISAWVWEGVISDEFLLSSNWFDCGVFNGPTPDLPIYFGPVEQFINGVSQGCVFPAGPAVLQSDFTSMRTLTMTSIGSPMLTVSGAFYTGSGTIGTAAQNDCGGAPGTATLVLDNAVWDGNITLGAGSGTCGELILRGHSMVTGSIMTSSGTAKFVNDGFFTFVNDSTFSSSTQGSTWTNTPGSTLVLANTSSSSYPFGGTGNGNTVVNQAGATILKDGSGSNNIVDWMLINQGTVAVEQGTLTINAGFECGGIIDVGEGAVLRVLEPDPELKSITSTITGAGTFELNSAPALFTRGEISPSPRDPVANPAGLTIDVPAIYNDQTSVFRTQIGSLAGRLTCTGVYEVAGDIDIQRFGDFEPDGSEAFVVIEADFVSGVFGDYFENAEPLPGSDTAFDVRTGDLEYDLTYTPTQVIVSNVSIFVPPCNPADLAEPGGLLDLADVIAFSTAFSAGDGAADIAEPFGLLDLADVTSFIGFFLAGCP